MATQWTAGTTAGQVLTAATLNTIGAAWESWTPTWTASTANPAIGNGFIGGMYARINKIVIADGYIIPGSTTTYGTGTYRTTVPITMTLTNGTVGFATLFDASAGYIQYPGVVTQVSTTVIEFRLGNATGLFSPTVPITLAQSDQLRFTLIYQSS